MRRKRLLWACATMPSYDAYCVCIRPHIEGLPARCEGRACSSAAALSSAQDSGGAGVMEQLASRCCRESRTSSVICSTLARGAGCSWRPALAVWRRAAHSRPAVRSTPGHARDLLSHSTGQVHTVMRGVHAQGFMAVLRGFSMKARALSQQAPRRVFTSRPHQPLNRPVQKREE